MTNYRKGHPESERKVDRDTGRPNREGVRDPSSHRTPEQIRKMDRGYNARPEMERRRAENNKARAMLGLKKGDPRDAGHKKMLDKGGKTTMSNLEPQSRNKNRGWRRDH
jgi:hypothetical protein